MELLVEQEVIIHKLDNNDEMVDLFNKLEKQVFIDFDKDCCQYPINNLNKHYNDKWNHTITNLRFAYFFLNFVGDIAL